MKVGGLRNLNRGRLLKAHWRDRLLLSFVPSPLSWRERLAHTFENVLMNGSAVTSSTVNPLLTFAHSSPDNHGLPPDWGLAWRSVPTGRHTVIGNSLPSFRFMTG